MPRVTWCNLSKSRKPKPTTIKVDYVRDLLDTAKAQRKMTYEDIAARIGEPGTGESLKQKRHRGGERFKVFELFDWFSALEVGPDEAAKALELAYKNYLKMKE